MFLFSSYVKDGSYLGFKVSQDVIKIVSPLLMSYFLLEWCLIARRRRELIKIIKHISFKVYKIKLVNQDYKFTRVGIFNRNVMPFSLMIEVLNIDYDSKIGNFLFRKLFLPFMFAGMIALVSFMFYQSAFLLGLSTPISVTVILFDIIAIYCLAHIMFFYKNEFKINKEIKAKDAIYIAANRELNN